MPVFSVIVPVYKAEAYLRQCLDSILAQDTRETYEVILVDDGSLDGSGAICDEYAARDPRFQVIHQENRGASAARNAGIRAASGEYILFLDADDWWAPFYLSQFTPFLHVGADMVQSCAQSIVLETGERANLRAAVPPENGETGEDYLRRCFEKNALPPYGPVYYLYRRAFLLEHGLGFPEGIPVNEDLDFNMRCLQHAGAVYYSGERCGYFYRQHDQSTVHNPSVPHQLVRLQMAAPWFDIYPVPAFADLFVSAGWSVSQLGTRDQVRVLTDFMKEHRRIWRSASRGKYRLAVWLFRLLGCYGGAAAFLGIVRWRRRLLGLDRRGPGKTFPVD